MAKKRKTEGKSNRSLSWEERKGIRRITRFCNTMQRGRAQANTNDHAWQDIVGAIKVIQRIAIIKNQDTLQLVKELERQTKKGPKTGEISTEAVSDKIKLANALIAQGMHWDKIEGALVRLQCLCNNEDDFLRGQWEFSAPELAAPPKRAKDGLRDSAP